MSLAALLSLEGQRALLVGGCGGIGAAACQLFTQAGAEVLALDRPHALPPEGIGLLPCDLADPAAIATACAALAERWDHLDILIHTAGITRDAILWKLDPADWTAVMRINLDSAFHLLHGLTPLLRRAPGGRVVLVSSINGERGKRGQSAYAASKAGLHGLMRTAARELGLFGIRVNAVAPGLIATPLTANLPGEVQEQAAAEAALPVPGLPEDIAHALLFLVSPMSRHITGQVLRVDGGQLIA